MDLSYLKSTLFKSLLEYWKSPVHDYPIQSFDLNLPNFALFDFYKSLKDENTSYFLNKDQTHEFLFLGKLKIFQTTTEIDEMESLANNNEKLIFLGGLNFDISRNGQNEWSFLKPAYFILPQVVLQTINGQTTLRCFFDSSQQTSFEYQTEYIHKLDSLFDFKPISLVGLFNEIKGIKLNPSLETWGQIFRKGIQKISDESFHKIVLARKKVFELEAPVKSSKVSEGLKKLNPNSYLIDLNVDADHFFICNTPERLFKVENRILDTDAIAGTRPRGESEEENLDFEKELKSSLKEVSEHRFVKKNLEEKLAPFAKKITWTQSEEILKLKYIQHLYSKLEVELKENPSYLDLLKTLHPTPAVGGTPWKKAKEFLMKNESFERGLYAAPVGVLSKNYCEFSVAIRSALFSHNRVHVYAGAGIVRGSQENSEWNEIENKMKNFEQFFLGSPG